MGTDDGNPPIKALRWHGRGDVRLDDVAEPASPGPEQAIVRVALAGVCGTDLHEAAEGPT
jgi:(R,R)-butanediol dehydrogenase/meso-butanediol dehydrogenase/diacetyl reductase